MSKKTYRRVYVTVAVLLIVAVIFTPVAPAVAAGPPKDHTVSEIRRGLKLAKEINPYLTKVDHRFVLSSEIHLNSNLDEQTVQRLMEVINIYNEMMDTAKNPDTTIASSRPDPGRIGYFDVNRHGFNVFWSEYATWVIGRMVNVGLGEAIAIIVNGFFIKYLIGVPGAWAFAVMLGIVFGFFADWLIDTTWPQMLWLNVPPWQFDEFPEDLIPPYKFHAALWGDGNEECDGHWQRYELSFWENPPLRPIEDMGCWEVRWPLAE